MKKIRHLTLMLMICSGLPVNVAAAFETTKKNPPNILIIMADDATYNDLPLFGGVNVETPNINRLAAEGLTFDRAFLSMSMCVPCRAALYTGLAPVRNGVCWNHAPARNGLKSIVQFLDDFGYRTGLAGKVHARPREVFPFEMVEGVERRCVSQTANFDIAPLREFATRDADSPFCLIAALVVPHSPWSVGDPSRFNPEQLVLPPYLGDTPETREDYAKYLAEIEVLDQQVGALLEMLEESGLEENTLVFFTSEQGAQLPRCKWTNWNMGIHTALIARWPGVIRPGKRTDAMVMYVDILPTLIDIAGGDPSAGGFDGSSFFPVLRGERRDHRQYAYFMHNNVPEGPPYPIRSITDGTYHYIRNLQPGNLYIEKHLFARMTDNPYWISWFYQCWDNPDLLEKLQRYTIRPAEELYRIDTDPNEMVNLAGMAGHQVALERLSAELDRWMKLQGDPGAAIDNATSLEAAREGNHFIYNRTMAE